MQLYSLGDLHDPLPSLDSMSWLDVALDSVASQSLSLSSSLEALEAAVQCDSLGDLHDLLPSLDSMSWLDECEG
jgi:muconolactone delta-isomerase